MTLRQAALELRAVGITLRKVDGEYQVLPKGTGPEQTYYTNDLGDALATGYAIARELRATGQNIATELVIVREASRTIYTTCKRCGGEKRRDSSCECALADAERYYDVQ